MAVELRPAYVKVAGQQKQVKAAYVKASGAWKEIIKAYTKVNGVWKTIWAPIEVSTSFAQCIDHWCTIYYDGAGKLYVQSREPSNAIHTGRADCDGYQQGNILRYSFDVAGQGNMDLTVTMSGRCGSGSLRIVQPVNKKFGPTRMHPTDWYGGAAVYSFTITGTIN